jgi:hypothetical protein
MSALPPIATEQRTSIYVGDVPFPELRAAKKVCRSARSDQRAADQPHRAAQAHARTVCIGRQRLAEGGDGG